MKESFLEELSKAQPNPGGGAAAAYGVLVALGLLEKVVRLELNRHGEGAGERRIWERRLEEVRKLSADFSSLCNEDVRAYLKLSQARASGKGGAELNGAIEEAIGCPVQIIEKVKLALELLSDASKGCKKHLVSDLQVGCELLGAAAEGAFHIACANLPLIKDLQRREKVQEDLCRVCESAREEYKKAAGGLAACFC